MGRRSKYNYDINKIKDWLNEGLNYKDIAEKMAIKNADVLRNWVNRNYLVEYTYKYKEIPRKKRVQVFNIDEIILKRNKGMSWPHIAKDLNVSQQHIWSWVNYNYIEKKVFTITPIDEMKQEI